MAFQTNARAGGIGDKVVRWSAVDAKKLDLENLGPEKISLAVLHNIRLRTRRSPYEIDHAGAIGCSLSHIAVWQRIVDSAVPMAVVFEDDCSIPVGFAKALATVVADLPASGDWDVVNFHKTDYDNSGRGCTPLKGADEPWWKCDSLTGSHGYLISRRGAQRLLRRALPIEIHIDAYIAYMSRVGIIRFLWHPALNCQQSGSSSDIMHGNHSVLNLPTEYTKKGLTVLPENQMVAFIGLGVLAGGIGAAALLVGYSRRA